MPSERIYYVLCEDNCRFESMTKEQILAAIAEATGNTPTAVDDAFITKIKEQNHNRQLKFWVGTQAEYNAIATKAQDVFYLIQNPSIEEEIEARVSDLEDDVDELQGKFADYIVEQGTSDSWNYEKWESGKAVCWRSRAVNGLAVDAAYGSMFYCGVTAINFPSGLFIEKPFLVVDVESSYKVYDGQNNDATSTRTCTVDIFSPMSQTVGVNILYEAIGKWK